MVLLCFGGLIVCGLFGLFFLLLFDIWDCVFCGFVQF